MQQKQGISVVDQILRDVKGHVEHMKDINLINGKIERMTGITNETYKVSLKDSDAVPVIFRRFGESSTNIFLDRDTQKIIYQHVSDQGLGPRIYCYIGEHTRIEEFIQSKVLKSQDMLNKDVVENVAFTLQKFHSMEELHEVQKRSLIESIFFDKGEQLMNTCREKMDKNIFTEKEKEVIDMYRKWVSGEEIQFLRQAVKPISSDGLIFSHNDLLANNVLIANSNHKYIFIDYEYSTYNYRIFDIANYFNEYSFDYDVKQAPYFGLNQYPADIEQIKERFITCYWLADGKTYEEYRKILEDEKLFKEESEKVRLKVERLLKEFWLGTMLSNIMWGWWAVIVCKNPNIQFDYLEFGKARHAKYLEVKNSGKWKI